MATYYWFGGDGDWYDSAHWSTSATAPRTSAGTYPSSTDYAVFDSLSASGNYTVTAYSGYCGRISMANPTGGTLNMSGSLYVYHATTGLTSTISAGVNAPYLVFQPDAVAAATLTYNATSNSPLQIIVQSPTNLTISGTMTVDSFSATSNGFNSGTLTFSSTVITANLIDINGSGNFAATTALNTSTFKSGSINFGGYGVYSGSGNNVQTPPSYTAATPGYVTWYWPSGSFPGAVSMTGVSGGSSYIYPTGGMTFVDVSSLYIGITPPARCGGVSLTRSNITVAYSLQCGALTMNSDATTSSVLTLNQNIDCTTLSSTGTSTAPNTIVSYSSESVTSSNVLLTNTNVNLSGLFVTGTLTTTSSPTSYQSSFLSGYVRATGAISFTSTEVQLGSSNPNAGAWLDTSLYTPSSLTVNGTALTNCVYFYGNYDIVFGNATTATTNAFTDVRLNVTRKVTVNGSGAFNVTNAVAKTDGFVAIGTVLGAATAPMTFTVSSFGAGSVQVNTSTLSFVGTTFTSGASVTIGNDYNQTYALSSSGSTTFTDIDNLTLTGNAYAITGSGSVAHTNTAARFTAANQAQFTINAPCASTSNLANLGAFSVSNSYVRVVASGLNVSTLGLTQTSNLYCSAGLLSATSTVTSGLAGTYCEIKSDYEIDFGAAATLINTTLIAPSIYVVGGSGKNFSYTYSTPVRKEGNYSSYLPEIQFDQFFLLNSGGTFTISSPNTWQRIFVRKLTTTTPGFATMSLATAATLSNVDFWRITPDGAAAKPWTGTNLGRVGTLPDITTPASKNVYRVNNLAAFNDYWDSNGWALTSGGSAATANYPLPQDNVIIDNNSYPFSATSQDSLYFRYDTRCNSIVVNGVGTGTNTLNIATPFQNANYTNLYTQFWLSGGVYGPSSTPSKNVQLFPTSYVGSSGSGVSLILADGTSADSQTIAPQNMSMLDYGYLYFANAGNVDVTKNITGNLGGIDTYTTGDASTRTVNFTCSTVVMSTATLRFDGGTYNFNNVSFVGSATNCYLGYSTSTAIANTSYTITCAFLYIASFVSATRLGNFNLVVPTYFFAPNSCSIQNNSSIPLGNVTFTSTRSNSLFNFRASCSMYSLTVSYISSMTFVADTSSPSGVTLTKVGGGTLGFNSGVAIGASGGKPVNASPASTWYALGTVRNGSTGWNSGSAPTSKGGFLLFQ